MLAAPVARGGSALRLVNGLSIVGAAVLLAAAAPNALASEQAQVWQAQDWGGGSRTLVALQQGGPPVAQAQPTVQAEPTAQTASTPAAQPTIQAEPTTEAGPTAPTAPTP